VRILGYVVDAIGSAGTQNVLKNEKAFSVNVDVGIAYCSVKKVYTLSGVARVSGNDNDW